MPRLHGINGDENEMLDVSRKCNKVVFSIRKYPGLLDNFSCKIYGLNGYERK